MSSDLEKLSKQDLLQKILKLESDANKREEEHLKETKKHQEEAKKHQEETKKHQEETKKHQQETAWLRFQLEQLKRMLFGSKRERYEGDSNQAKIEFEEYASDEQQQDETPVKQTITYQREKPAKKHNGRNSIPEGLPVVEHVVEPEEDTTDMKKIGEERTEILEYVPEKFFKLVIVRPKYARTEQQAEVTDPEQKNIVIEIGRASCRERVE